MGEGSFFCKVNKQDGSKDSVLEEKHAPVIKVEGSPKTGVPFSVTVDVGEGKHPNLHEHFIQWVDLYANWIFLARIDFSAVTVSPKATLNITLQHEGERTLRAFAKCNMHGVWEGTTQVQVAAG